MKRVKLKHGSARIEDNCSAETIEALNKLSELLYKREAKTPKKTEKICKNCGCGNLRKTYEGYWCKMCKNETN